MARSDPRDEILSSWQGLWSRSQSALDLSVTQTKNPLCQACFCLPRFHQLEHVMGVICQRSCPQGQVWAAHTPLHASLSGLVFTFVWSLSLPWLCTAFLSVHVHADQCHTAFIFPQLIILLSFQTVPTPGIPFLQPTLPCRKWHPSPTRLHHSHPIQPQPQSPLISSL